MIIICGVTIVNIVLVLLLWLLARTRPPQARDRCVDDATGGITTPQERTLAGRCRPPDVDSPPVYLNLPEATGEDRIVGCHRVLLIKRCSDPMMWYYRMVGQEVPYLGQWGKEGAYKSREPSGYVNIVRFTDAEIVIKETK